MIPESVRIVEVGPRDGLQNEPSALPPDVRADFILSLQSCGLKHIEGGSFVHPERVPQMRGTDQVLARLPLAGECRFPVLVPNVRGLEDARAAGARDIAVFAAASETFSQKNINCGIRESIRRFRKVCTQAQASGITIRGYISCVMGCPYEGDIPVSAVEEVAVQLIELGCHEISLGDTIGVGTPGKTGELIETLGNQINRNRIAVHFHDTYGQALANIYAALQQGVSVIDSSVAGLGGCPYAQGASGNVATEDVVYMLNGLGVQHGIDLEKLVQAGRNICTILNRPVMSRVNLAMR
ncbi:MAG: hydroxymethylglutaryl-CoA lyase [Gammaproteobacteria bacterium]|nr:hydroxymethylglutaryl-CoA lyase [Gammaproteobacteria bacterium]